MDPNNVQSKNVSKNLSRFKVLFWVNEKMDTEILKVEELCIGAVYCQLMDMLFPDAV
ncbi:microtubule-associated protein RP/EB family member 1 [Drosophila grimshawi]|uniref:GH12669 n=1 Tax=Drosophila grimshawi TaxID=7222 RepID=B4JKI6_DROGR|nr:microtubule-associated protein RP/EB family member 1 [Drosophila grimshawi]EDW00089.1 GH12669 [Drosophila grimshawi]EDW00092.1 GH12671 [Drosophila grimshawi]